MVKIPEPVDPVMLYEFSAKEVEYDPVGLKNQLDECEAGLDKVYESDLQSGEYTVISYQAIISESLSGRELGEMIQGGFDLSVKDARTMSLPGFQRRYKRSFKKIAETIDIIYPIDISIFVIGFRDRIIHEAEAFEPPSSD